MWSENQTKQVAILDGGTTAPKKETFDRHNTTERWIEPLNRGGIVEYSALLGATTTRKYGL